MDDAQIDAAVRLLRAGGVVALPTETVYGLAADAANDDAVRRIYAIKGRPADHPLILHVADGTDVARYARGPQPRVDVLAARFWPGPLTVIVPKSDAVGSLITGGQTTVALRVPDHPLMLAILRRFGGALAAPSANRYGRVSPTSAAHVRDDLGDAVDLIVDGGPARVGVESTILDLTSAVPAILRVGAIGARALGDALGTPVVTRIGGEVRASGTHASHYAPRAQLILTDDAVAEAARRSTNGEHVGILTLPSDPHASARTLYATLRALDAQEYDTIVAELPPDDEANAAVRDRLTRAAAPRDSL
jgi:L-threonylcarbamoyladenylate synthase